VLSHDFAEEQPQSVALF